MRVIWRAKTRLPLQITLTLALSRRERGPDKHPDALAPPLPPPVDVRLTVLPAHSCPYLPNRVAILRAFAVDRLPAELYHDFMDAGFRRSGRMIYQPVCDGCRRCVPLRVPVDTFRPNKSQRRCARRNADLLVSIATPAISDEKFELYRRYVLEWHENRTAAGTERGGGGHRGGVRVVPLRLARPRNRIRVPRSDKPAAAGGRSVRRQSKVAQQRLLLLRPVRGGTGAGHLWRPSGNRLD